MKQLIRIFQKDSRQLWPEILLSWLPLVVLVLPYAQWWKMQSSDIAPMQWNQRTFEYITSYLCASLSTLAGWIMLIARVVSTEPLAGGRAFWRTRPYDWKQLLGAKALFLVLYLYLPLVVAQCLAIVSAGVNPLGGIALIVDTLLLLTAWIVLPAVALATLTSNLARMVFAVVGVLAALILFAALWSRDSLYTVWHLWAQAGGFRYAALALALLCLVVIVLQYATRRTMLARGILLAGALVFVAALMIAPRSTDKMAARAKAQREFRAGDYAPVAQPLFQIAYDPVAHPLTAYAASDYDGSPVYDIRIPMSFTSAYPDSAIHLKMIRIDLAGANGFHWSILQNEFWPTEYRGAAPSVRGLFPGFFLPAALYERVQGAPLTATITLYYDQLRSVENLHANLPVRSIDLPGGVHCGRGFDDAWLECRTVASRTAIYNVNADFSVEPCPAGQKELAQGAGPWWSGFYYEDYSLPGLVPLRHFSFTFARDRNNATGGRHLCKGAPVTFTHYRIAGHAQSSFSVPIQLPVQTAAHR